MKKILAIALALLISVPMFSQGKLRENFKESVFGIEISMIYVEGGEFMMGGTSEQGKEADKDEVIHRVTVGDFFIGQFEITQSQWEAVMETSVVQQSRKADAKLTLDKLNGVGPDYPMYYVTWEEAMEFCRILSKKTGKKYTLPTEAEWEFAARGGVKTDARSRTKYAGSNLVDFNPEGPAIGEERVIRGGSWHNPASRCRVSYRGHNSPERRAGYRGFRIVCHDVEAPAQD